MPNGIPNIIIDPVTKRAVPAWTPEQEQARKDGKAALATHGSHTNRSLHSYEASINALASLISPAVTYVEPTDQAAGDLVKTVTGKTQEGEEVTITVSLGTHFADLTRLLAGVFVSDFGTADWTEHDILSVFVELDGQAKDGVLVATNAPTFAELTVADQTLLWEALKDGTLTPITIPVPAATMTVWYGYVAYEISVILYTGWPNNTYRTGPLGWGMSGTRNLQAIMGYGNTDEPILTDADEGISRPDGAGSLLRFLDFQYPEQAALRDLRQLAFVHCNSTSINPATGNPYNVDSEAAFTQLKALYAARGFRSFSG